MSSSDESIEKYYGSRGDDFTQLIRSLLKRGRLNSKHIDTIIDKGMNAYKLAFTHSTVSDTENYEYYEMLGDATVNCAIVWYLNECFPHLHCPGGVKIIARLKINLVSKRTFGPLGEKLGLWPFVSADQEIRDNKMKQTLEDVFEAFFGVTCSMIDTHIKSGAGFKICANIIKSVYDEHIQPISLKYEHLFDAKTRLKETFDYPDFKMTLSNLKYTCEKNIEERMNYVNITASTPSGTRIIGQGTGPLKPTAEQNAARDALSNLARMGFKRPVPDAFKEFCS